MNAIEQRASRVTPYTIRTIIEQLGGTGLRGALMYVGAHSLVYKCSEMEGECRPYHRSEYVTVEDMGACVAADVFLKFKVNGKRGQCWYQVIAYEPDDTYSVWLMRGDRKVTGTDVIIECARDVYCDSLKDVVEHMYDRAIKERNGGFINLS